MTHDDRLIIGLDLGGTKIAAALATADGQVLRRHRVPTPARQGPDAVVVALRQAIEQLGKTDVGQVSAIGVGAPGPYNSQLQVVSSSPHLAGWQDVPLKQMLEDRLGTLTFVDNDANVAALGEHRFGAGIGTNHMIYITVSTGIGGGLILGGKLYTGASGAAGEIGHMTVEVNGPRCQCGNYGCWEALASGTALAREAVRKLEAGAESRILELAGGDLGRVKAEVVFEASQQGDKLARSLIERAGYYLGVGLASLIDIFNPEMIVIGGGMANMGEALLAPARTVARQRAFALPGSVARIVPARLGDDSGVLGAVALVLEGLDISNS